jgi:hypothetical protein
MTRGLYMDNADTGKFQLNTKLVGQPCGKGFDVSTRECCCRYFVGDAFPAMLNDVAKGKNMWSIASATQTGVAANPLPGAI